jgi:alkylation response protein AidB-like acyl-CoA dehydrogenase
MMVTIRICYLRGSAGACNLASTSEAIMLLTPAQSEVRQLARQFAAKEIAPYAAQWDRDSAYPAETIRKMGEVGLLGMTAPEAWGGSAADSVLGACDRGDRCR